MPLNEKKRSYASRLVRYIHDFKSVLVVEADNVGSKQLQQIRFALRAEKSEVLMGKNTTIRKVIKDFLEEDEDHPISALLPEVWGNVGLVFSNGDLVKVVDAVVENKVPAPARVGAVAPVDVFVEPGPTGCDPGQTGWFQALNIPTKINKGQIEMISRVHLVSAGSRVGDSEAALLQKLGIRPFSYGLKVRTVYDKGTIFDPIVLRLSDSDLLGKFMKGVRAVAALSIKLGLPNRASIVHSINNAFKACLSVALETDYSFPRAAKFADFLANPANFVVATAAGGGDQAGAAEAAKEEEEEEEEEVGGAGGLFDEDDDW